MKILETLKTLPSTKIPPCGVYKELVDLTGLRNSWTVGQWIEYLTK